MLLLQVSPWRDKTHLAPFSLNITQPDFNGKEPMPTTSTSTRKETIGPKKTSKDRPSGRPNRGGSFQKEKAAPSHSGMPHNPGAQETLENVKHLATGALLALSEIAVASVRDTVNKGLQSRPAKAIKSSPVRAGLIAAGVAALAAAGVFGTQTIVRKKRAKSTRAASASTKDTPSKGARKRSPKKAGR